MPIFSTSIGDPDVEPVEKAREIRVTKQWDRLAPWYELSPIAEYRHGRFIGISRPKINAVEASDVVVDRDAPKIWSRVVPNR